jgi:hypothetical protein
MPERVLGVHYQLDPTHTRCGFAIRPTTPVTRDVDAVTCRSCRRMLREGSHRG